MVAVGLNAAQVFRHLRFKRRFRFAEEMVEQDILGRDRRIGFKFMKPVTIFALLGGRKSAADSTSPSRRASKASGDMTLRKASLPLPLPPSEYLALEPSNKVTLKLYR